MTPHTNITAPNPLHSEGLRQKIRLGDLLVDNHIISKSQLDKALATQKQSGTRLGRTLIDLGYIDEKGLLDFLSQQLRIPYVDLRYFQLRPAIVKRLPETLARRFRAIVLEQQPEQMLLGFADPTDLTAQDEISRILKAPVGVAIVRENDLLAAFDTIYRRTEEISSIAEELGEELAASDFDLAQLALDVDIADAPVVRLLQSLLEDAVQIKASDIHIEPDENVLRLRLRIDGVLQEQVMKEKRIAASLVSRLKLMAGLNITERRLPQDGRFNIRVHNRAIDVRLSTMPTLYGESVVMRLLDQSHGVLDLEQVGMSAEVLSRFRRAIHKPHGMVLVTGPTGSGKTTTLYGALGELNLPGRKIITIEDPVEYRLSRINQVQVNPRINLTFASVLRTALRQDPDVILVGEIRDQDTAEIALRAAMTGHLVLATLHTNDAISTANRLMDMGAPGYLVATSLEAVLAQRLVRKVCPYCAKPYPPDTREQIWLDSFPELDLQQATLQKGEGCMQCNNTGYRGRIGIFEFLDIDKALAETLRRNDSSGFYHTAQQKTGFKTLAQSALELVANGTTTIEEALRIAGEAELDLPRPAITATTPMPQASPSLSLGDTTIASPKTT